MRVRSSFLLILVIARLVRILEEKAEHLERCLDDIGNARHQRLKGERIDFGATPLEELGLDPRTRIEFELVGGADLGRDGERYLVLRGENRGSTLLVVDGHMHAVFPGDERAELCLDGLSPPFVLELSAGALSMQVQIELDGTSA